MKLNKDQQEQFDKLFLDNKNLLLFWKTGVGKTFLGSAIVSVSTKPTLVVCPKVLLENWKEMCISWSEQENLNNIVEIWDQPLAKIIENIQEREQELLQILDDQGEEPYFEKLTEKRIVIINYEKLNKITDVSLLARNHPFGLVICDESHKLKSVKSWSAKHMFQLKHQLGIQRTDPEAQEFEDPIRFVLMTGTPVANNKLEEYFTQLRLTADYKNKDDFFEYGLASELGESYYRWLSKRRALRITTMKEKWKPEFINAPETRKERKVRLVKFPKQEKEKLLNVVQSRASLLSRGKKGVEKFVWLKEKKSKIKSDSKNIMTIRQKLSLHNIQVKLDYIKEEFYNDDKDVKTIDKPLTIFYQFKEEKNQVREYLENTLKISPSRLVEINGQHKEIEKWSDDSIALIQTQVSEGYNILASCQNALFLTPPISSTQFTQSKGRLDRKGQQGSPIFHLLKTNKLDDRVYQIIKSNYDFEAHHVSEELKNEILSKVTIVKNKKKQHLISKN